MRTGPPWTSPCPKCGMQHLTRHGGPACVAHTKQRKNPPCQRPPSVGQRTCAFHGGGTAAAKAAGKRRIARAEATRFAGELAELLGQVRRPDERIDSLDSLLEAVDRTTLMARALWLMCGELDLKPDVAVDQVYGDRGGVTVSWRNENSAMWGADHQGDPKPHVLLELLRVWTESQAKICKMALDAGVSERQIQLAEDQAQRIAVVLRGFMRAVLTMLSERLPEQRTVIDVLWREEIPGLLRAAIESTVEGEPHD